ncbi:Neutral/alkaline non-lysosomal ceramidase [Gimesia maris]|uniref:neutral/alkaline non-lysosomal ceramidase N-terminal domain-containing protein n=1 Tax=Gimesia maris TaxID=122 RepID=UPI00118B91F1|nr:neutral/alkaline non-lysosomal ceramidase N-terminal domain-containing protein [Gimesia maris]QDT76730.1 Neutral/alkaline non-lysosomal ceramidase [Gimesia maris]
MPPRILLTLILPACFLFLTMTSREARAETTGLRAGAAAVDITPPPGTSLDGVISKNGSVIGVHDRIFSRALVLDDGHTRIAICVNDLCMVERSYFDRAKQIVFEKTGLPVDRILMTSTHTHAAPRVPYGRASEKDDAYYEQLIEQMAAAIIQADQNLAPAQIAWGSFDAGKYAACRRFLAEKGSVSLNPFGVAGEQIKSVSGRSKSIIQPAAPIDPQCSLLSVQHRDGSPLAVLGNMSIHYSGGYQKGQISADYFGAYARHLAKILTTEKSHPPFVGMLSNGTSGNVGAVMKQDKKKYAAFEWIEESGQQFAEQSLKVINQLNYKSDLAIDMLEQELELGIRRPDAERLKWAREILEHPQQKTVHRWSKIYATEAVELSKYPPNEKIKIQAIRIGGLGIAGMPCEVFTETGLAIKDQSPFKATFSMELANGSSGYLPTPQQHALGGYETWPARSSYLEIDAETKIRQTALKLLNQLHD